MSNNNVVFCALVICVKLLFAQGSIASSIQYDLINTPGKSVSWRLTSSSVYTPSNISSTDTIWEFKTRDTLVYNELGKQIASVLSFSSSGWETENIHLIDSTIYIDKRIIKKVTKYLSDKKISSLSFSSEFAYGNDNKSYTQNAFSWDTLQQKWIEDTTYRYTINCSSPIEDLYYDSNFNFLTLKEIRFANYSLTKIDTECNETTFTLEKQASRLIQKMVYEFITSDLLRKNIQKEILLEKNSDNNSFDTLQLKNYINNGYEYFYRSDGKLMLYQVINKLKDSHNNDSTYCFIERNSYGGTYDTLSKQRFIRSYDSFGNNTVTIELSYNFTSGQWVIIKKRVNKFAMSLNALPIKKRVISGLNANYLKSNEFLTINASKISSVKMTNVVGQSVFSLKYNDENSVLLNLAQLTKHLNTGIYFFWVTCNQNEHFSFSILNK